jgi:hypothetical protein
MLTILQRAGISPAEYAVLWHVRDTVVRPRDVLSAGVADNLPNNVPSDISLDDCLEATVRSSGGGCSSSSRPRTSKPTSRAGALKPCR